MMWKKVRTGATSRAHAIEESSVLRPIRFSRRDRCHQSEHGLHLTKLGADWLA